MNAPVPTAPRERSASASRERFNRIYASLRDRICMLEYPPGGELSEEALALEFGVSRTPIRRVLSRLEAEGLVLSHHGVGTIVTDVQIEALTQVFELRMEVDQLLGRLSPVPRGSADLERLRELVARCEALLAHPDPKTFARLNMDFMFELTAMTANAPLRQVSERLFFQTARIWLKTVPRARLAHEVAIFRREMTDVLAALEIGDLAAVGHIRRSHISMSFVRMKAWSGKTI